MHMGDDSISNLQLITTDAILIDVTVTSQCYVLHSAHVFFLSVFMYLRLYIVLFCTENMYN